MTSLAVSWEFGPQDAAPGGGEHRGVHTGIDGLAKPGGKYLLLRAVGDLMNEAGMEDGDLLLVRQQPVANKGDKAVALMDDEATARFAIHSLKRQAPNRQMRP